MVENITTLSMPNSPWNLPENFPLRMMNHFPQPEMPIHDHNYTELAIVTSGFANHNDTFENVDLVAGSVVLARPGQAHSYCNVNKFVLSNICFDESIFKQKYFKDVLLIDGAIDFLQNKHNHVKVFNLPSFFIPWVTDRLNCLNYELSYQHSGYEIIAKSIFIELLAFICRHYPENSNNQMKYANRIIKALTYLENNYNVDVDLQTLADIQKVSKSSLIKFFKHVVGATPMEHLINIRLQKAIALFSNQSLSLTQIAYLVGFNDSNYFSRQFKNKFNVPPRIYRKQTIES